MSAPEKTGCHSDLNKKLNVAYINTCTEAEGPYKRMAVWFQGCDIKCKGCCNPSLQPLRPAHLMTVGEIVETVLKSKRDYGIEGVTFLGGEPTLQQNLPLLSKKIKELDLGVILFTGHIIDNLDNEMIQSVDLIVDGKFEIDRQDNDRNLIGSTNQNIIFVSERYKDAVDWFFNVREKRLEINVSNGNDIFINGDVII